VIIQNNISKSQKVNAIAIDSLVTKSQQTLEQILDDKTVSASVRAEIALKILQMAHNSTSIVPTITTETTENFLSVVREPVNEATSKVVAKQPEQLFLAKCIQIDNFLKPEEYQQALDAAFDKQAEFVNSRTVTNAANYRSSSILYATLFPELYYLVKNKILAALPLVLENLNYPEFAVSRVEMQMTAHNDACFYKVHTDAGSEKTKDRQLTYVYYFYQEPKQFSGGELKIYDTELQDNSFKQKEYSQTVEPRNNSIVFFNSRCKHEVLPIICPSQNFQHSRFTLNGWLRK
jgi:Rps23 Pro-64 3,4-dihydroxylase Tpa1-like proline 4-hydroxylase